MHLLPMASSPDSLISARYAVIMKTPAGEVLTTTSNVNVGGGGGSSSIPIQGFALAVKHRKMGSALGPLSLQTLTGIRFFFASGSYRQPRVGQCGDPPPPSLCRSIRRRGAHAKSAPHTHTSWYAYAAMSGGSNRL